MSSISTMRLCKEAPAKTFTEPYKALLLVFSFLPYLMNFPEDHLTRSGIRHPIISTYLVPRYSVLDVCSDKIT